MKKNPKGEVAKKSLKDRLEEKKKLIIANAKDAHFVKPLLDDLLSIKGQLEAEPCELIVKNSEVLDIIEFDEYRLKVCATGVLFETKGGFHIFVEPRTIGLYKSLMELVIEYKKEDKDKSVEKELFDNYFFAWMQALQMPIGFSVSPNVLLETVTKYIEVIMNESKQLLNMDLQQETPNDTLLVAEGEEINNMIDEISESINNPQGESEQKPTDN